MCRCCQRNRSLPVNRKLIEVDRVNGAVRGEVTQLPSVRMFKPVLAQGIQCSCLSWFGQLVQNKERSDAILVPVDMPLLDALGHVLATDISAPLDLPPSANSGMDGYAVRREDIVDASEEAPRNLKVIGLVAAGQVPTQTVLPATAVRIMTGATIPSGADTVVPFEETDEVARKAAGQPSGAPITEVAIMADLPYGCNVRPAGEDVRKGNAVSPRDWRRPTPPGNLALPGDVFRG